MKLAVRLVICICSLLFFSSVTFAQEGGAREVSSVSVDEWQVPWSDTRPRDPFVDQQGRVWFCGQVGNYVAYFEPDTETFERFDLEPNTNPHNLIVDEAGAVWYAGNQNVRIGKLDPETGDITTFPMPDPAAGDPHTLVFGEGNDLWFTVQWGNFIGRLDRASGEVQLIPVPTPGARPYGIKIAENNRPWIVLFGTNKLATVDPATMQLSEVSLPRAEARPRRMEITDDGNVWYVDYAGGYLGRYNPESSTFDEWLLPGGADARPYGTALDHLGRLWIAETGTVPNRLVGFDPETETFLSETEVPSGGSVRHMYFHPPTRDIWFGVDTGYLARAKVGE